jgi:ATP-dependent RNA helicase MSS116
LFADQFLTTDSIAQARTGTGKTLGFLIPVIQNVLNNNPELVNPPDRRDRAHPSDIRAIIISPTRELSEQIATEAKRLTRSTSIVVQIAVGGNSKREMLRQMQRQGCHLLVATPGRLKDLLTDPYSKVSAPDLNSLVLDEADRLLDDGFSQDIEEIVDLLPNRNQQDRQTLLFSATVPREVMRLVRDTLKPDFQFVQTIQRGEAATHEKIPQKIVNVGGLENMAPTLLELCKREMDKAVTTPGSLPFKAIVYSSSTANVILMSEIFRNLTVGSGLWGQHPLAPAEISQIHAKLTQQRRESVVGRFRRAKSAILFSTDVTARGMDFPNVTHVIQTGLPPTSDQYIHRVGRTGRGDKGGEGWILLCDAEMREARNRLKGLPLVPDNSLEAAKVDMTRDAQLPEELALTMKQVADATQKVHKEDKTAAYMAMLGVFRGAPQAVVDTLNQWTQYGWGWEKPPAVSPTLARKIGFGRVSGLNIGHRDDSDEDLSRDSRSRDRSEGSRSSYSDRGSGRSRNNDRKDREYSSGGFGDRSRGGNSGGGSRGGSGSRGGYGDRSGGRSRY